MYENEIDAAIVYNIVATHFFKDEKKLNKINISKEEYSKKEVQLRQILKDKKKIE